MQLEKPRIFLNGNLKNPEQITLQLPSQVDCTRLQDDMESTST